MWETAADSIDVASWTKRENLKDDPELPCIEFDRGKTGVPAIIPISQQLAASIRANGSLYLVTDPMGRPYDGFKDDAKLRGHLGTLRKYAIKAGAPHLKFDHLRHGAATHAVECGADPNKVMHLTAHSDPKMARDVYVQQSREITTEIQQKRGIIR